MVQSDEVDHADGTLVRQCNRKLRGAAMLVAENLIKCHPYYRGLSELWKQQKAGTDRRLVAARPPLPDRQPPGTRLRVANGLSTRWWPSTVAW